MLFIRLRAVMSFRNYSLSEQQQNIKIEEEAPSQLFLSSKFPANYPPPPQQQVLVKMVDIVVAMHQTCLSKCQNIQIYRDLNEEEQELMQKADKSSMLHTVLAGILAVDSCLKAIEKEQKFITANILRANSTVISHLKKLQRDLNKNSSSSQLIVGLNDSIKFLTLQIKALPSCREREAEIEKQLALLQMQEKEGEEWTFQDETVMLSELQRQKDMLKLALREKDSHILTLQGLIQRGARGDRKQDKKTAHSLRQRLTQRSSEGESSSQHVYQELNRVKQEIHQKNRIVQRMNEQFATQMEKYNSVFKRLEDQNRQLKKYSDLDTTFLLEELQIQIQNLKEQRYKDQNIIGDIQRKFEGFSFAGNRGMDYTRGNRGMEHVRSQQHLPQYQQYQQSYQPQPLSYQRTAYRYQKRQRMPSKFYSPNYNSRLSPFERPPTYRQESFNPPETGRSRVSRRQDGRNTSRLKYGNLHSKRQREPLEHKSSPTINLLQRVMAKGL